MVFGLLVGLIMSKLVLRERSSRRMGELWVSVYMPILLKERVSLLSMYLAWGLVEVGPASLWPLIMFCGAILISCKSL